MSHRFRIRFAATAALAAGATVLAGCSATEPEPADATPASLEGTTIVVSTFPFGVEEFEANVVAPFEEATGANVEIESGSNADRLTQLQLAAGDPGIDVMLISDYFAALGQSQDLFQEFDSDDVPNLDAIKEFANDPAFAGPAYTYQLNGILYRTDSLSAEEASDWSLFGNQDYAGRLALPDIAPTAGQLTISGIAEQYGDDAYDVDTAFSTMGEWSPGILQFYTSTTEVTNLLVQGEIVATPAINAFATPLIEAGEPISWTPPAEGRYMATNRLMIPEGAPNVAGAYAFIDYLLSAEAQEINAATDLPVHPDVAPPQVLVDIMGDDVADPIEAGYSTLDPETIVETRTAWVERFAREVSGL